MKQYDGVTYDLSGKVAIITGASGGIFREVAKGYAEAGAQVAIVDVNMDGAEGARKAIEDIGGTARVYNCDIAKVPVIVDTVKQIIADFGKVDILINGAGVNFRSKSEEFPEEKWDFVLDVQAKGTFFMCREVGRHMLERGEGGKIVNTSSMLAYSGGVLVPAYAAAKAAIHQFTKSLCNEWSSKGINVNGIAPGYILTDMTRPIHDDPKRNPTIMDRLPVGRWGKPEDMVGPFLFLGSGASNYVHGTILTVDGGWMAR